METTQQGTGDRCVICGFQEDESTLYRLQNLHIDKGLSFRVTTKYIFAKLVYDFWIGIVLLFVVAISENLFF